jgi:hypothetical protein
VPNVWVANVAAESLHIGRPLMRATASGQTFQPIIWPHLLTEGYSKAVIAHANASQDLARSSCFPFLGRCELADVSLSL